MSSPPYPPAHPPPQPPHHQTTTPVHNYSTPTRASLLTGRYAVNVGLPFPLLAHAVAGIDPAVPTMAEKLKDAGYRAHLVGKWHVGNAQRSMLPTKRGFDSFFGLVGGGFDHYTKDGGGQVDLWRCVLFAWLGLDSIGGGWVNCVYLILPILEIQLLH